MPPAAARPSRQPKLLLHTCCAPCLTYPLEVLKRDFAVTVYFSNSNIHPRDEYQTRLAEAKRYCETRCEFIEDKYDCEKWFTEIRGFENEPERGERCRICYRLRLAQTAKFAAKNGFEVFATTLSISPHKNANWLNEIGTELAQKFNVKFQESNWKKKGGFQNSITLSREFGLKRQNYCGCIFSRRDT